MGMWRNVIKRNGHQWIHTWHSIKRQNRTGGGGKWELRLGVWADSASVSAAPLMPKPKFVKFWAARSIWSTEPRQAKRILIEAADSAADRGMEWMDVTA